MLEDIGPLRFQSMGCIGAIVCVVLIVAAVFALLYIPWSLVLHQNGIAE